MILAFMWNSENKLLYNGYVSIAKMIFYIIFPNKSEKHHHYFHDNNNNNNNDNKF